MNFQPPSHPAQKSILYGGIVGISTVLFWALMSVFSLGETLLLNLLLILALFGGIAAWILFLRWAAEAIYQIPWRIGHVLLGLLAGYIISLPLLLLLPLPSWMVNLTGFFLGGGAVAYWFSRP